MNRPEDFDNSMDFIPSKRREEIYRYVKYLEMELAKCSDMQDRLTAAADSLLTLQQDVYSLLD